jgi:hypothetical protein
LGDIVAFPYSKQFIKIDNIIKHQLLTLQGHYAGVDKGELMDRTVDRMELILCQMETSCLGAATICVSPKL